MKKTFLISLLYLLFTNTGLSTTPNVIFILTDDQGYNDLAHNGNPYVKTPEIDKLASEATRFTDFHVLTSCAPSRAMLMTGRYAMRTGVWCTVGNACRLSKYEVTIADIFQNNGYKTALFGKWHLGDNYPFRPQDRGFSEALWHGAGGVGNTPDHWANDYFDDTYLRAGKGFEKHEGFCTDVWFNEAIKFIEENRKSPFFCYLSLNAPHLPFVAPQKYKNMYPNEDENFKSFYGMITNIDDNIGRLRKKLDELNISKNTIFIFSTDNGSVIGMQRYNAGMSGYKRNILDGGHRVPLIIHWPEGGLDKEKVIDELTCGIDLFPTLVDLCNLKKRNGLTLDGKSLKPLFSGAKWPDRTIFIQNQWDSIHPVKWYKTAVLTKRWRLLNNNNLFDIKNDSFQKLNVFEKHPEVVKELNQRYDKWWETIKDSDANFGKEIVIGSHRENPVKLTGHDNDKLWNHDQVLEGFKSTGSWDLIASEAGIYEIELRRYPIEANAPISGKVKVPIGLKDFPYNKNRFALDHDYSKEVRVHEAQILTDSRSLKIKIPEKNASSKNFSLDAQGRILGVKFLLKLPAGPLKFQGQFNDENHNPITNAYFIYIKKLDNL